MKHASSRTARCAARTGLGTALLGTILVFAAGSGCNSASSPSGGNNPPGALVENPDGSGQFIVDPNNAGLGQAVRISATGWGRMANVFDLTGALMHTKFVIGDDIQTGTDYLLERNSVTAEENLTIRYVAGTAEYVAALKRLDQNLTPIFDQGFSGSGVFSMVPRNSALSIRFDDLLDPALVSAETIKVRIGVPTVLPFEARIFIDPNHGDLADFGSGTQFFSTRVIVDTTVTEFESFDTDPPLPVNGVGLPPSVNVNLSNTVVRIPTREDPLTLQTSILRNPSGHALATSGNGSVDFSASTDDVVRAMRSGGNQDVTGDPFNGFLRDESPPRIVGVQAVNISPPPTGGVISDPSGGPRDFIVKELRFVSEFCAQTPSPGDIIRQPSLFAQVTAIPAPQSGGVVVDLKVTLLLYPKQWDEPGQMGPLEWLASAPGPAQFLSTFDATVDLGKEACFLQITPTPTGYPFAPDAGLSTMSQIAVRFSEPMDPASVTAFDTLTLTRKPSPVSVFDPPLTTSDYVVGSVEQSLDLQQFTFIPELPLAHAGPTSPQGATAEPYYLLLHTEADLSPTDLAGNPIQDAFAQITTTLEPSQTTQFNGGRVSRFTSQDEEEPFGDVAMGPLPEFTGQHLYDIGRQLIRPRPVIRFEAVADRTQPVPGLMTPAPLGSVEPLIPLGSKLQTLWRYVDVGLTLTDPVEHNLDVEGLNWAPLGGQILADHFDEFEISLAHSLFAPDEYIAPGPPPFIAFPNSGLVDFYTSNLLDPVKDPQKVVHPRFLGYTISPGQLFSAGSGTLMIPFPLNQTVAPGDRQYYTWRDTSIQARGGPNSSGYDPLQLYVATGDTPVGAFYGPDELGTIALPLLMEFRCYVDGSAIGLNTFDISYATPITFPIRPVFTAFSAGGVNQTLQEVVVDPDLEVKANGGFNPNSIPSGGTTPGIRDNFYVGGMDLVVRVSRSYSIWFQTLGPINPSSGEPAELTNPSYRAPVMEPKLEEQPQGTDVRVALRGATSISSEALTDASTLDSYGDHYGAMLPPNHDSAGANIGIAFQDGDAWYEFPDPGSGLPFLVDGAEYYQLRITFLSNTETGLSPELSALGITWEQ